MSLPNIGVGTKTRNREQNRAKLLPPYNVIIENDDFHSMEFVVEVLLKVLNCQVEKAVQFALQAHNSGRAIIWTGPKEVAELKHEQVTSFHEIRDPGGAKLGPVGCIIEPAPGG